ncbi:fungal hydrophobin [Obba rivulosa]|uniref:Hydrophobin n=1 Tax=Obba rivulosa TaxID=1052685 RepID=A0A8E2AN60_9APHY|nr:fungal hydrophobin [Obba rivulosa]
MKFTTAFAALACLATLAAATPAPGGTSGSGSSGTDLCCETTTTPADSQAVTTLLGLLGVVLSDINVLVGIDCSPITVVGVGSGDCSSTSVSCSSTQVGGLIGIGCIPITL